MKGINYPSLLILGGLLFNSAQGATTTVIADTILLQNSVASNTAPGDAEANFGGRTELIIGSTGANKPRHGLVRFNVSDFSTEINNGQNLTSARLVLSERSSRNGNNANITSTITVHPLISQNSGWLEGNRTGSSNQFDTDTVRSVSHSYLATPSSQNGTDGLRWFSQGGGATTNPPFSSVFNFQIGTDSASAIGSHAHTFDSGNANETVSIDLNLTEMDSLLPTWLADGNSNAGLLLEASGTSQLFFGSIESGNTTDPAMILELDFAAVPEPSSTLLGLIGALGLLRRRR